MRALIKTVCNLGKASGVAALIAFSGYSFAEDFPLIIDDFNNHQKNSLGIERQFMDDKIAGGSTHTEIKVLNEKLHLKGDIIPPRGQPGWASSVQLLHPDGLPQDVSMFEGIRLLIKIDKGNVSVSANSLEVTNFDYHTANVRIPSDGKFHEVKLPFTSMKRAWSEQTALNTATINSVSVVVFGMQKTSFSYEIDEIGFY